MPWTLYADDFVIVVAHLYSPTSREIHKKHLTTQNSETMIRGVCSPKPIMHIPPISAKFINFHLFLQNLYILPLFPKVLGSFCLIYISIASDTEHVDYDALYASCKLDALAASTMDLKWSQEREREIEEELKSHFDWQPFLIILLENSILGSRCLDQWNDRVAFND